LNRLGDANVRFGTMFTNSVTQFLLSALAVRLTGFHWTDSAESLFGSVPEIVKDRAPVPTIKECVEFLTTTIRFMMELRYGMTNAWSNNPNRQHFF
jgi:hypothetical protein